MSICPRCWLSEVNSIASTIQADSCFCRGLTQDLGHSLCDKKGGIWQTLSPDIPAVISKTGYYVWIHTLVNRRRGRRTLTLLYSVSWMEICTISRIPIA
jgi:hypothetical protein